MAFSTGDTSSIGRSRCGMISSSNWVFFVATPENSSRNKLHQHRRDSAQLKTHARHRQYYSRLVAMNRWLERLNGGLAALRRLHYFSYYYNCCSSSCRTLTISSRLKAASPPLLPALVPERSIACSMVSVVNTPKATGRSNSKAT